MKTGTKYILFLKAYPDDGDFAGKYFPVDLEYGKYIVPSEFSVDGIEVFANDSHKLEIGSAADLNIYSAWYSSIMREYFYAGKIEYIE